MLLASEKSECSDAKMSSSSSSSSSSDDELEKHFSLRENYNFEPLFLDTSNLRQGQHLTVVQLPSLRLSFLPYASEEDAKNKRNKMFHMNNP